MSSLSPLFVLIVVLAAALASISVWSPRQLAVKVGAVAIACALMLVAYTAMIDLLSKPKPTTFEWWLDDAAEATVLGSTFVENEAIYVWLQLDDVSEPRAYALPWSQQLAQELQDAGRQAAAQDSPLRMRVPFEPTLDDREPRFYAMPQPAMPPKDGTEPPAELYTHPGTEA